MSTCNPAQPNFCWSGRADCVSVPYRASSARRPGHGLVGKALISTGLPLPITTLPVIRELSSGRGPGWADPVWMPPKPPPAPRLVAAGSDKIKFVAASRLPVNSTFLRRLRFVPTTWNE